MVAARPVENLRWRHGLDPSCIEAMNKDEGVGDFLDAIDQIKKLQTASCSLMVSFADNAVMFS
jgi:hypothetical protein